MNGGKKAGGSESRILHSEAPVFTIVPQPSDVSKYLSRPPVFARVGRAVAQLVQSQDLFVS